MDITLSSLRIGQQPVIQPSWNSGVIAPASSMASSPDFGPAYTVSLSAQGKAALDNSAGEQKAAAVSDPNGTKKLDGTECETCKNRRYQDGSNDANVSFKAPGHISPGNSAAVVASHEQEHVSNARAEDQEENKELVSSSVRLFSATCPECGRTYTAGGETNTVMRTTSESKRKPEDKLGKNVDIAA